MSSLLTGVSISRLGLSAVSPTGLLKAPTTSVATFLILVTVKIKTATMNARNSFEKQIGGGSIGT